MNRIDRIRTEERNYHDFCYENHTLFQEGSWLYKPVKTVVELLSVIQIKENPRVLDLGSGVGRNSIPIAKALKSKKGKVICVDLIDSAIDKLKLYSKEHRVEEVIEAVKADIGKYEITKNAYDLIIAVSALEHVESVEAFEKVTKQIAMGTKRGGINCIIVNSEVEEFDLETSEKLDAWIEVNMKTDEMMSKLCNIYAGWEVLKQLVKPLEYTIVRDKKEVIMKTNAVTFVARKVSSRTNT